MRPRQRQSQSNVLVGTRLAYNAGVQADYVRNIKALLAPMMEEVSDDVIKFFEKPLAVKFQEKQKEMAAMDASVASQAKILTDKLTEKFDQLFGRKVKPVVDKMVSASSRASSSSLKRSLKSMSKDVTLKTDVLSGPLKEVLKASINENVELITTIGADYLTRVKGQVMRSIATGNGLEDLVPALKRYKGYTERKAKNVALDQTRKVYNQLNKGRMESAGIKQGKWLHSGGGQNPRKDHIALSGTIFDFANPPIIDKKTGERGFPGQAINCGCTFAPVITFSNEEK